MPHDPRNDETLAAAAMASLGALPADEARAVSPDALREFESVTEQLALASPELQPPARLRDALLARMAASQPTMHVVRTGDGAWKNPFPGVSVKTLFFDRATAMMTNLIRMQPGASYPPHRHSATEQCLVLEGEVRLDDVVLGPGDYSRNDALSDHGRISTSGGCLLLIISCAKDELLA